jgi:hypothetical protein
MGFSGGTSPFLINNYIKLGLIPTPTIYMVHTIIKSTQLDLASYFLNAHEHPLALFPRFFPFGPWCPSPSKASEPRLCWLVLLVSSSAGAGLGSLFTWMSPMPPSPAPRIYVPEDYWFLALGPHFLAQDLREVVVVNPRAQVKSLDAPLILSEVVLAKTFPLLPVQLMNV